MTAKAPTVHAKPVPWHLHRPAQKKAKRARPETPARQYPPGWFTEPVRAWKGMKFESRIEVSAGGRLLASIATQEHRAEHGVGFGSGRLALENAPKSGRPAWMGPRPCRSR